eukprot:1653887-Prymnesium_polylepis.1
MEYNNFNSILFPYRPVSHSVAPRTIQDYRTTPRRVVADSCSFADDVARERERGGTGADAHRAAAHLLQHLNSILAKQHHMAVTRLTRETT